MGNRLFLVVLLYMTVTWETIADSDKHIDKYFVVFHSCAFLYCILICSLLFSDKDFYLKVQLIYVARFICFFSYD